MSAQSEGNYAEALQNYYEATRLEIDPYAVSYTHLTLPTSDLV